MNIEDQVGERLRCPKKVDHNRALALMTLNGNGVGLPDFIDEYCDSGEGPILEVRTRGRFIKKILGPTKIVEVCCTPPESIVAIKTQTDAPNGS